MRRHSKFDERGLPAMLAFVDAGKRHHDHTHARGADTREICMRLMPNFDERRAAAGLCSQQVNPLVIAGTERSSTEDTVQNDDFHLGRVW